jgi:replicative DNA helicase
MIHMDGLTSPEFSNHHYDTIKKKHENPEKFRGFSTGIPEIEQLLGGFHLRWYIVIGGPEKAGKTALMLSNVLQFAMAGKIFMWVNQDMSNLDMGGRTFANLATPESGVKRRFNANKN